MILRCKEAFSFDLDGVPQTVTVGALFDSADPVVQGRDRLFEPVDAFVERRHPVVEQATAAPGEKRSAAPLRKPSGSKAG